ncbi:MAG: DUF2141 domain-containing protein [Acidithiobacillales bacterium]
MFAEAKRHVRIRSTQVSVPGAVLDLAPAGDARAYQAPNLPRCGAIQSRDGVEATRTIMTRPTIRKPAVDSAPEDLPRRVLMFARYLAWFVVLTCASLPDASFAQSRRPGIHVTILHIRNSTGNVACALFESPVGFPREFLRSATTVMVIKVRQTQARCDFEDIPPGTYALAVIHDENMNGKLDANWLGIPTESYGFLNQAKGILGAPSFSRASFPYDGQNLDLTLTLRS